MPKVNHSSLHMPTGGHKGRHVTSICGNCEYEWDADLEPADQDCPVCMASDDTVGHVVRLEGVTDQ